MQFSSSIDRVNLRISLAHQSFNAVILLLNLFTVSLFFYRVAVSPLGDSQIFQEVLTFEFFWAIS